MFNKQFLISWISSSVLMFGLFYVWHGVVLNDLSRLSYPVEIFTIAASIVYLFIGLAVTRAYVSRIFNRFKKQVLLRGLIAGSICGIIIFLVSLVTGVTFSSSLNLINIALDFCWQAFEQAIGGAVVGVIHFFVHSEDFVEAD